MELLKQAQTEIASRVTLENINEMSDKFEFEFTQKVNLQVASMHNKQEEISQKRIE